jgi:hypothetical protein
MSDSTSNRPVKMASDASSEEVAKAFLCLRALSVGLDTFPINDLSVDVMRKWGLYLWDTYAHEAKDLTEASELLFDKLAELLVNAGKELDIKNNVGQFVCVGVYDFLMCWAHWGYPVLTAGHKFAAACMATTVSHDAVDDLEVNWPYFTVIIPDGLIPTDTGGCVRLALVATNQHYGAAIFLIGDNYLRLMRNSGSLADLFERDESDFNAAVDVSELGSFEEPHYARVCHLVKRFVAALLLTMQHTNNYKPNIQRGEYPPLLWRNGPPKHRTYVVGRAISVDCRAAVRAYAAGSRYTPPSVQTLVRGHHKRQVIGIGRTGRKVIWIEPYWRGPEDAPILTRPYNI